MMASVVKFSIYLNIFSNFVVAMSDLVHNVEAILYLYLLTASGIVF